MNHLDLLLKWMGQEPSSMEDAAITTLVGLMALLIVLVWLPLE